MSHPESEHGLRVQLATATKERDDALERERCSVGVLQRALAAANEQTTQANARADAAGAEVAASDEAVKSITRRWTEQQEALAAARRECEGLRAALRNDGNGSWWMCGNCDGWMIPDGGDRQCVCDYGAAARAALGAPAAAAGVPEWHTKMECTDIASCPIHQQEDGA